MTLTKDDYERRARELRVRLEAAAQRLGEDHPIRPVMGSLAWGRYDAEGGPDSDNLRGAAVRYGFLWGCERLLVAWCNANGDYTARSAILGQDL